MSHRPQGVGPAPDRIIVSVLWLAYLACLGTCAGPEALSRAPEALPHPAPADTPDARRAQDLDYLVATFDAIHPDPFMNCPEAEFRAEVAALRRTIPELDDGRFQLALMHLVALLGDAHSDMDPGVGEYPVAFPARIEAFDGEFRVVYCLADHSDLLGARVLTINGHPIEALVEACGEYIPAANPHRVRLKSPGYLVRPRFLHEVGLGEHFDRLVVEMELADGELVAREFEAGEFGHLTWHHILADVQDLPRTMHETNHESGARYWWEVSPEEAMLYFQFNKCRNHADYSFETAAEEVLARIGRGGIETVVIDVRYNTGGNNRLADPLIDGLAARAERGEFERLFVLTGATTFSSGVDAAVLMRSDAGATLVGTPTGGMPNSFGDAVAFTLPNSKIAAQCSSGFYRLIEDDPATLEPHVDLGRPWSDYSVGRDTAMEWVRSQGMRAH